MQDSTCRNCTNCGCKKNADVGCTLSIGNIHKTGDIMSKKTVTLNSIGNKTFVSYLSLLPIFGYSDADVFYDAIARVFSNDKAIASLYLNSALEDPETNLVWLDEAACRYLTKFLPIPSEYQETFDLLIKSLRTNLSVEAEYA